MDIQVVSNSMTSQIMTDNGSVCKYLWDITPSSVIPRSEGRWTHMFLLSRIAVSVCLHSHQQCMSVPICPHVSNIFVSFNFLTFVILKDTRWLFCFHFSNYYGIWWFLWFLLKFAFSYSLLIFPLVLFSLIDLQNSFYSLHLITHWFQVSFLPFCHLSIDVLWPEMLNFDIIKFLFCLILYTFEV